ncbi:MAG: hypothetical protein IKI34_03770, partial [Eubacterium sp.]|nr:hypothetical protein [Eubacterium sp.]
MQKIESMRNDNSVSKKKIISGIKNEKRDQHYRNNTMILNDNNFNEILSNRNNFIKQKMAKNNKK